MRHNNWAAIGAPAARIIAPAIGYAGAALAARARRYVEDNAAYFAANAYDRAASYYNTGSDRPTRGIRAPPPTLPPLAAQDRDGWGTFQYFNTLRNRRRRRSRRVSFRNRRIRNIY